GSQQRAMPLTKLNILKAVEDILEKEKAFNPRYERNILSNPQSGHEKRWKGFRERKGARLSYRTSKSLNSACKNLSDINIRQWFSDASSYLKDRDMGDILEDPSRIYN
ncbi:unnamed protein product, partial [Meganyctiphanes norvegica]